MPPETMNMAEAAAYLKLGIEATQGLFETGVLPGVSLNQKHTLFLRASLDEFIRETARRQSEQRRNGIQPPDRAAASPRGRATRRGLPKPDLDANENRAARQ
jgi:hypothetical protein